MQSRYGVVKKGIPILMLIFGFFIFPEVTAKKIKTDDGKYLKILPGANGCSHDATIIFVDSQNAADFTVLSVWPLGTHDECNKYVVFVSTSILGIDGLDDEILYVGCDDKGAFKLGSFPALPTLLRLIQGMKDEKEVKKVKEVIFWTFSAYCLRESASESILVSTILTLGSKRLVVEHHFLGITSHV